MARFSKKSKFKQRKRTKAKTRVQKKDPLMVDGAKPRPMFVDYKDIELLKKLTSRQGKIISRRKNGCSAASQHAVAAAIKRARFMALLPYITD
ncbi:MAG: 30S ribosomal protein S18 [Thermoguttaceae bacterium]